MRDKDTKILEETYLNIKEDFSTVKAKEIEGVYDKGLRFMLYDGEKWKGVELIVPEDFKQINPEGISSDWAELYWDEWLSAIELQVSKHGKFGFYDGKHLRFFSDPKQAEAAYNNPERIHAKHVNLSPLD